MTGAWIVFEDEAGQTLRPPRARTRARKGHTPTVRVNGKGSGRVSIAGLVCVKPGRRGHVFYRLRVHRNRVGERRSLSEDDYATLITAAHHQLHAPIILIWDGVNTHTSRAMRHLIAARHRWLTVVQLPAYAPDLNPDESLWSTLKAGLGNLAVDIVDHLTAIIRNRLKRIQYRPDLIPGFLAQTGLSLEPEPP
ncbi:MAG TPA: transposase [Propionicimonas sp.]|nr:transposase [Propionicimonas sp.]